MGTPRKFIDVLENSAKSALVDRDEGGELLLRLIVHTFFADNELAAGEVALMQRLLGEMDEAEVREHVHELASRGMDFDRLAQIFTDPQDRDDVLTLAEHAVWGDERIEREEMDVLDKIVEVLEINRP